ncbi:MAG: SufD family Fe-S cluster assembly protein [Cyanobacteriota/Melainabacteria group bacterium]
MSTITREGVDNLSIDRGEPEWLKVLRVNALEKFLQSPNPSIKSDTWRKTRVDKLNLAEIKTSSPAFQCPDGKVGQAVLERFSDRAGAIFSTTGNSWRVDLDENLEKAGVVFVPIDEAIKNHAEALKTLFESETQNETQNVDESKDKFDWMQEALFNCGAYLEIPANLVVEKPFLWSTNWTKAKLVAHSSARSNKSRSSFQDLVVNAFVCDNELDSTVDGDVKKLSLVNARNLIQAEAGSSVSYIEVQALGDNCFMVGKSTGNVTADANVSTLTVGVGGYQLKSEISTRLIEAGAHGAMLGVVFGDMNEHMSYNTIQEHAAPNTTSDINFRVALKDEAVSAYQGNIKVDKVAQKTNAYQTNKNLLLGKNAKADSIPKLEILANDVKCSHGATVGPVDQDQVFYLMVRGLDKKTAEELIVAGFFDTVLESLPDKVANDWIHDLIKTKIHKERA